MVAKKDNPEDDNVGSEETGPDSAGEPAVAIIDEDPIEDAVERDESSVIEDALSKAGDQPEAEMPADYTQVAEPVSRRAGVWLPAVVGAALALAVSIAFVVYETRPGGMLARDTQAIDDLRTSVEAVSAQLDATTADNAALSAKLDAQSSDIQSLSNRLNEIESSLADTAGFSDTMSAIETRLTDLENRPIPDVGATEEAVAAYETQLAAMRAMLEGELQKIKAQAESSALLQNSAADLQRAASIEKLTRQILIAVDEGAPIAGFTQQLAELGVVVPQALASAADGVVSTAQLGADFPPIARALVEADIRGKVASGEVGRLEAFMRLQLGARSTAPREGDDVESVVARAEAHLLQGDLASAVDALNPLRENTSPALRDWLAQADAHLAAVDAATNLSAANE